MTFTQTLLANLLPIMIIIENKVQTAIFLASFFKNSGYNKIPVVI